MRSDLQTLIITTTGLLCHIKRVYPIGAKGDELLDCYQPNVMSVCFVLAVSLLLSMRELWPSMLRCPSRPIRLLYLILVTAFTVSVSLRLIWLPLTISLTKINLWLATKIKTNKILKQSLLIRTVELLESRFFHKAEMAILAFVILAYALKASCIYGDDSKPKKPLNKLYLAKRIMSKPKISFVERNSQYSIPYALRSRVR